VTTVKRKKCGVEIVADLLRFLRENHHLEKPDEIAASMFPEEFPATLLAEAIQAGRAKAFSALLQFWLVGKGLKAPKGVFACDLFKLERPGRPREPIARKVYTVYEGMAKPTFGKVAQRVFPDEYKQNSKKATDRARQLYNSYEKLTVRQRELRDSPAESE
jgi:hypothetical protein